MKLLKFGDITINIARAIRIDDHGSHIDIDFVASDNPLLPLNVQFTGGDAAALRRWIAANAEEMSHVDEESTGEALDDPRPYISPR